MRRKSDLRRTIDTNPPICKTGSRALPDTFARIFLLFSLTFFANPSSLLADSGTHDVHTVFIALPSGASKPSQLDKRVATRLRQSGSVQVVNTEDHADAVLHLNAVLWPIGSMSLNPHSQSGHFLNYQGYASADLTGTSRQALWSYLATPKRFHMASLVDNLADQISEKLVTALKSGIALALVEPSSTATHGAALRVAGATFPAPLYAKWFESFAEQPSGISISYSPIGSVQGIAQLEAGSVDIAASDIPPSASASPSTHPLLRLPSVAGGIVPIYNIPGVRGEVDLTGEVLADIYSGKITRWNDPRILALNKGLNLHDAPIVVIHRSDGSGTTFVWTSYLALISPDWKSRAGASVDWPVGVGKIGNEGVADTVSNTANSIGYVELTYAIHHQIMYAAVRNPAGRSIKASLDTITAAANSILGHHDLTSTSILNSPDKDAYPIATFTWLVVPESGSDAQHRASIKRFLQWMLVQGQGECSSLGYAPLPRELAKEELRVVNGLN